MGNRLTGKVALVTGAARGLGEAFARSFVAEGASVFVTDVLDEDGERLAAELGDAAQFRHLDVTSEKEWATTVADLTATFGGPHVLVNNAGISRHADLTDIDYESFDRAIKINLYGTFLGMREVAPPMGAAGGGSIVNIASSATKKAVPGSAAYAASKWGVRGMTKVAALDLAPLGIRVNSVHPGPTETPMLAALMAASGGNSTVTERIPVGRLGSVDEIADAVLFLASSDSSFVNGAELVVDGGFTL